MKESDYKVETTMAIEDDIYRKGDIVCLKLHRSGFLARTDIDILASEIVEIRETELDVLLFNPKCKGLLTIPYTEIHSLSHFKKQDETFPESIASKEQAFGDFVPVL